jgi:hypothetical protein
VVPNVCNDTLPNGNAEVARCRRLLPTVPGSLAMQARSRYVVGHVTAALAARL